MTITIAVPAAEVSCGVCQQLVSLEDAVGDDFGYAYHEGCLSP